MRRRIVFFSCLVAALCGRSAAQEQPTKRLRADEAFERYEFASAARLYLQLAQKSKPDTAIVLRLATCYDRMNRFDDAEAWYRKLDHPPLAFAEVLLNNAKFDEAKDALRRYYGAKSTLLTKKLDMCDSARAWLRQPTGIIRADSLLNSAASDWGLTDFGKEQLYLSDKDTTRRYGWAGRGFFRFYAPGSASLLAGELNRAFRFNAHIGPAAFSPSLDTAYVTVSTAIGRKALTLMESEYSPRLLYTRRLELFILTRQGKSWSAPKRFRYSDANRWSAGQAAISADGQFLYFVSDRAGGQGGLDLWYCRKQADGNWSRPVNCGKTLNTAGDEAFPTISGGHFYFSSSGLPGMGGYDIFTAEGSGGSWTAPRNLRSPVNSPRDDFWFRETATGGTLSSNRAGGLGDDDIYRYSLPAVQVTGPPPPAVTRTQQPKPADTLSTPLVTGTTLVLRDIYYDLDKWDIRADAAAELDNVVATLNAHPNVRIELSSHTDSRAPDEYNLVLSQKRAQAAVDYLVAHGISRQRLLAKGYGETRLVNRCANGIPCTEAEHQRNRRTEIRVLNAEQ